MAKGKFVWKITETGLYRFNLIASNGQVIATSGNYKAKASCLNGIQSVQNNAPKANLEDQTIEGFVNQINPTFEVFVDKAGEYRFRLKARNGEIILASEGYSTKPSCLNGVESVRANAPEATIVQAEA